LYLDRTGKIQWKVETRGFDLLPLHKNTAIRRCEMLHCFADGYRFLGFGSQMAGKLQKTFSEANLEANLEPIAGFDWSSI
jgi:hypothetical protein